MTLAGVEGAVCGDAADLLLWRNLVEQFGQHGSVADVAHGELDGADFQGLLINSDVDLAPNTPLGAAMLAGVPLPFALDLYARAVDQKMERARRAAIGDVDLQCLLATADGAEVGHRPVQSDQPQQALDEAGRLPERDAEQDLHRQAGLDGGIAVGLLSATPACRRGIPAHLRIEPDRQRAAALERFVVGRPVPGLVGGGGDGSAHASQLPRWIHEMNPSQDLCNRASVLLTIV